MKEKLQFFILWKIKMKLEYTKALILFHKCNWKDEGT